MADSRVMTYEDACDDIRAIFDGMLDQSSEVWCLMEKCTDYWTYPASYWAEGTVQADPEVAMAVLFGLAAALPPNELSVFVYEIGMQSLSYHIAQSEECTDDWENPCTTNCASCVWLDQLPADYRYNQ